MYFLKQLFSCFKTFEQGSGVNNAFCLQPCHFIYAANSKWWLLALRRIENGQAKLGRNTRNTLLSEKHTVPVMHHACARTYGPIVDMVLSLFDECIGCFEYCAMYKLIKKAVTKEHIEELKRRNNSS